jgi:hypothetical protein
MRELRMAATGRPAPFGLGAPAYLVALAGWLVAAGALLASADELTRLATGAAGPVTAAHAIGLVFFPFAVAAAVWQLLPVMLRNDPPRPRLRWAALSLLLAGVPLTLALRTDSTALGAVSAVLLGAGLALVLLELVALVRGAPEGRLLVVSRPAVALAGLNAALAFAFGAVAFADGGPEPLGVPYDRFLLVHLSLALIGWLTVLILAVGRTLVPMLGLAAAAPARRAPVPELLVVAGLWLYALALARERDALAALGLAVVVAGLAVPAARFVRVAVTGRIGAREGPVAHVVAGLAFLAQAAAIAVAALLGAGDGRRAAVACVVFVGVGWAVGVIVGHLGKLVSLSGWGSWPPGPRPRQAELYPRTGWLAECALLVAGVELLAVGVLVDATGLARTGAALLGVSALVALACGAETVRRVVARRP